MAHQNPKIDGFAPKKEKIYFEIIKKISYHRIFLVTPLVCIRIFYKNLISFKSTYATHVTHATRIRVN
jgi:hypothetical protein